MATDLDARYCLDAFPDRLPSTGLAAVLDALAVVEPARPVSLRGFRVYRGADLNPVHQERGEMSPKQLLAALERWDAPEHSFVTGAVLMTNRESGGSGPTGLRIRSDGGRQHGRTGDAWLDGQVRLSAPVTPWMAPTDPDGAPVEEEWVERNLDRLAALLSTMVAALRPAGYQGYKVYTDAGEYFPFNAHLAGFADPGGVLRDVAVLRELFTAGSAVLELPPLGEVRGEVEEFVFHLWRPAVERHRVRDTLAEAVAVGREPDRDSVAAVVDAYAPSGQAPALTVGGGRYPLNAFLDEFYELLLCAKG
jgi:hypothetical protein